ncbi:hypothetical protein IQ268_09180 [Oculatella sp. LEGE 06141]|uniref:hypothetical protein n=1 Tax=Oculatella sp. LEGE 06141 TaxID=1828648 RepID=UPI0019EB4536|nr:hypothetical protein [Oculatella sp. LEGE 06141]
MGIWRIFWAGYDHHVYATQPFEPYLWRDIAGLVPHLPATRQPLFEAFGQTA